MKRLVLVVFAAMVAAALVPQAVPAKGATQAKIEGPGLDEGIILKNRGLRSKLGQLADATGFYPGVFTQIPDPMLRERPAGELGPRYTITWVMPGPNGEVDELEQHLYPYAKLRPALYFSPGQVITYVAPGQPFFGTERTHGGWYVTASSVKDELVAFGLPESPPTVGGGSEFPWAVIGALAGIAIALALATLLIRRHGIVESQEVSP